MSTSRASLALALTALLSIGLPAQQFPPESARPRFGTSTAAVVVDVIVRDRKGNPITDLTRDDFEVFENGTPQAILDFERVLPAADAGATVRADTTTTTSQSAPAGAGTLQGQSVVAVVFDWLTEQSRVEAWKAASTLTGLLDDTDYIGVFMLDEVLRPLVPYTRDVAALQYAFDRAVTRPRPGTVRDSGILSSSLVKQTDLPLVASAESPTGAGVTPTGAGPADAAMAAMLERLMAWDRYINRTRQGDLVSEGLTALVRELGQMPGRKSVVLFSEGLALTERSKSSFEQLEDLANSNNVTFYTLDAAGLRVHSRQQLTAQQLPAGESVSTGIADDAIARRVELLWTDPSGGLEPLAERTGGFHIGDTNDLKSGFARVNEDRRYHYLLGYSSTNPRLDGTFRKIDVKVRRPDVRVRARSGYVASPKAVPTDTRAYEAPLLAALKQVPEPHALPFQPRAVSTPMKGQPGLVSLIAAVPAESFEFKQDGGRYDGEALILARVVSGGGEVLATQSQVYDLNGTTERLDALKQGGILFFRTPEVGAGAHTVEWVVRDGISGRDSVMRSRVDVPLSAVKPVVGDLLIIDRVEKVPEDDPGLVRHPLAWQGTLLYPSLGAPIDRTVRKSLTFMLPMLVEEGAPAPAIRLELLSQGRSLGVIPLSSGQPDDQGMKIVGQLPVDKLPPGNYELNVTVTAGGRSVARTAVFTLVDSAANRRN